MKKFNITERFKIRIYNGYGEQDSIIEANYDQLNQLRLEIVHCLKERRKR